VVTGVGKHYDGPVKLFPEANNQDGSLDLLIFRHLSGWEFADVRALMNVVMTWH
jgi:diacylglycerol kinase family enzyme